MPDVNYNVDGTEGWLELKYGLPGDYGEIRAAQAIWIESRVLAGGLPLLLYQYVDDFYLAGGWAARRLRDCPGIETWEAVSCVKFIGKIHPDTFFHILENPEVAYGNRI